MQQVYEVTWVDANGAHLPEKPEYIIKESLEKMIGSIGQRCYQYPHKIPEGAYGFIVVPIDSILNEP